MQTSLFAKLLCSAVLPLCLASNTGGAASASDTQSVNIAKSEWGTVVAASSQFSLQHGVYNLMDGSSERGHAWLSVDNAPLPQTVTFTFEQEFPVTRIRVRQTQWNEDEYRTKDLELQVSRDGKSWRKVGGLHLANAGDAMSEFTCDPTPARGLRLVITRSYRQGQVCGLGEVEIYANQPKDKQPPYVGATREIEWKTLRGMFKLSLTLDPAAPIWIPLNKHREGQGADGQYRSGEYRLTLSEKERGKQIRVVNYEIRRADGKPFKVVDNAVECKRSYSGVYKIFNPTSMAQQNYKIDLPHEISTATSGLVDTPVVWMQQTDGTNTFTVGMVDQIPFTTITGSTYNPANGGEAQGIANSYVRVTMVRNGTGAGEAKVFKDGIYVNADPEMSWHEALIDYSGAVDKARNFKPQPIGENAFNSMWHSWYAHSDKIDEAQIRRDARDAAALGVKTIEIDAGWNMNASYGFDNEGTHEFDPTRFPNGKGMVDDIHKMGLKVILHVSPLLMGKNSKYYPKMKEYLIKRDGKEGAQLDPRYKKVQDYLFKALDKMFKEYGIDGVWYDFMEIPGLPGGDPANQKLETISPDIREAYTMLMQAIYRHTLELNPNAAIIIRRGLANLNSKTYCTHVWPMDTPQDYNMNRRDIVYMKTYGDGVLTHACCTSWAISESDVNVARQMASIVMAGVPAFSVKLAESPKSHNEIIKAWLKFYEPNKRDLVMGKMTPIVPTPPSAALRIESGKQAFFGLFEIMPGLLELSRPVEKITIVNAYSNRLVTRLEGGKKDWKDYKAEVFDQTWKPISETVIKHNGNGLNLDIKGPSGCFTVVLTPE